MSCISIFFTCRKGIDNNIWAKWEKVMGMSTILFTPENEMCRTSIIKIYQYTNRELGGTVENSCLPEKVCFQSSMQLIFLLEELYNELNFPQSSTETRSFISIQTNYLLTKQRVQQLREQVITARKQENRRCSNNRKNKRRYRWQPLSWACSIGPIPVGRAVSAGRRWIIRCSFAACWSCCIYWMRRCFWYKAAAAVWNLDGCWRAMTTLQNRK